jgi:hypothetical protein
MSELAPCWEEISLTAAEIHRLESVPEPAHLVEPVLPCELQVGHAGPHLALAQAYGGVHELWLRWLPPHQRDLVQLDEECLAVDPDPEDPDDPWTCELPAGHVGAHTFELEEGDGRTPTPEMMRRMEELLAQPDAE